MNPSTTTNAGRGSVDRKPDTGRVGIVLAGGRSERFTEGDKALAELAGKPLVAHVVASLGPVVDEFIVSCRADQIDAISDAIGREDVQIVADPVEDRGPVAGLQAALAETSAVFAVALPCDRPAVPPAFLEHLLHRTRDRTGAVPDFDGERQPFPVAFHVRAGAAACVDALESDGSLEAFLDSLSPVTIPESEVRAHVSELAFIDVDTPADLRRLRGLLAAE